MSALHQEGGPILKKTCLKKKTEKCNFALDEAGGLGAMVNVSSVVDAVLCD